MEQGSSQGRAPVEAPWSVRRLPDRLLAKVPPDLTPGRATPHNQRLAFGSGPPGGHVRGLPTPSSDGVPEPVYAFLTRRWFLLSLGIVLLIGWLGAAQLAFMVEWTMLRRGVVAAVLFLMALPLDARTIGRSLRSPRAPLLGIFVNLVVVPLLGWATSFLLPSPLALGLIVAAVVPSTLASAAVWTRRAGGNDATSMLVTVVTNGICFLVTPLWLTVLTGQRFAGKSLDTSYLIGDLALLVVLPMALAQLLRLIPVVGKFATLRKVPLGVFAQLGILYMIFIGAIQMGLTMSHDGLDQRGVPLAIMVVVVMAVHLGSLWLGMRLAKWMGIPREDQIAVGFSGSQKTLMVGLQISLEMGVSILPMVAYHIGQLLADTVIADRMRETSVGVSPAPPRKT
jgi:solute carrier family 10 (sodium/bile acid cotransporter), member 7